MNHLVATISIALSSVFVLLTIFASSAQSQPESAVLSIDHEGHSTSLTLLENASFECTTGYYTQTNALSETIFIPNHWNLVTITGTPTIHSARIFFAGSCDGSAHVERLDGIDSIVVRSQDIESPPTPGKPFDVAFYQQVSVLTDTDYSLSGWMLSLCGGSTVPNDCPADYYIAKQLGLDPTGGIDPEADHVIWAEDRRNFTESRWANLYTSTHSEAPTITIFARLASPFQWHGNHGFIDALSLVRSPTAAFVDLPEAVDLTGTLALTGAYIISGNSIELRWEGEQSPDVLAIGGTYRLLFDIQYRAADSDEWIAFVTGHVGAGCAKFTSLTPKATYDYRIRPRAEQAPPDGVFPTQRYPGAWSTPITAFFKSSRMTTTVPTDLPSLFLPLVRNHSSNGARNIVPTACATS